jgi:hypothetical protein
VVQSKARHPATQPFPQRNRTLAPHPASTFAPGNSAIVQAMMPAVVHPRVIEVHDFYGRVHRQRPLQGTPWPGQIDPTTQEAAAIKVTDDSTDTMLLAPKKGIQLMILGNTENSTDTFLFVTSDQIRSTLDPNPPDPWRVAGVLDRHTMGSQVDLHAWGDEYRAECTILPSHWLVFRMDLAVHLYRSSPAHILEMPVHLLNGTQVVFRLHLYPQSIWKHMR